MPRNYFNIAIPGELYNPLKELAAREDRSITKVVGRILREALNLGPGLTDKEAKAL